MSPDAKHFEITLAGGATQEIRFSWPAIARCEEWLGAAWHQWDLIRFGHLQAAVAAGMLHGDKALTPEKIGERLETHRVREYREAVDEALLYAITGKTQRERIQEEQESAEGEAQAATPTP